MFMLKERWLLLLIRCRKLKKILQGSWRNACYLPSKVVGTIMSMYAMARQQMVFFM